MAAVYLGLLPVTRRKWWMWMELGVGNEEGMSVPIHR